LKKILLLFLLVLYINLAYAVQTDTSPDEDLRIELISYDPSPVQAGDIFQANFKLTNIGSETIKNIRFEFSGKYPIFPEETETRVIDELAPGEEAFFDYLFYVRKEAFGSGKIYYQYTKSNYDSTISGSFTISIETLQKNVDFDKVIITPKRIAPGQEGKITFFIKNPSEYALTDLSLKVNFTSPFIPVNTTNERRIKRLATNEISKLDFSFIVDPNAEIKPYILPVELTYYDTQESKFTKSLDIGIIVDADVEYNLGIEDSDPFTRNHKGKFTISISNTGPTEIKFLSIELKPTKDYEILSNSKAYIGNIEPDDFETEEFEIYVKKPCIICPNKIPIRVILDFKDNYNREIHKEEELQLRIFSRTEARAYGLIPKSSTLSYILLMIIIIYLYIVFREFRKVRDLPIALKNALKKFLIFALNILRSLRWSYLKRIPRKIRIALIKLR